MHGAVGLSLACHSLETWVSILTLGSILGIPLFNPGFNRVFVVSISLARGLGFDSS